MSRFLTIAATVLQALFPIGAFALGPGEPAPAFNAMSTHGPIGLGDYAGRKNVVLALYYKDFTPV